MEIGHHPAPQAHEGRVSRSRRQAGRYRRCVQGGGASLPNRHRLRDVAHRLRRAKLVAFVSRQATTTPGKHFDISAIDFDRLRAEFERRPTKRTDTLTLMDAVEKRFARMLAE